ncbi:hypothetical protein FH609_001625 [Streptomyces sp. 3MP-14]|uniref:Lipoprotein n=1 Tax=Streptomyces mimosae TaxID=2586635 RepID=A0A5N6ATA0_9ACTN|nr:MULTISPECIES: hypothetical protein [Streptomyces]KAB8170928.1 hypothetical protein FH607_000845 [Streptomyces mimosae]KAB8179721.1 hypothetical protein FH609_001625 [Streptomyces sp. 3MP-14]
MTRRLRTALLAATATALLLTATTACGDDSDDGGSDDIPGVDEGGTSEVAETPTDAPPDEVADRPEITLPEGFTNVYEDWESDDPTEQQVLNDAREAQNSVDLAILERDPEADHLAFYHRAEALTSAQDWIGGFVRNDRSIAGSVRYFAPQVTLQAENAASLTYCADESEATATDVNTGEPIPEDGGEPFVSYTNLLEKDERGVWVTTSAQSQRGQCG